MSIGELHINTKNQLQCRYCFEHHTWKSSGDRCPFCVRMRYIETMKLGDHKGDKREE
jgi:hypothetical protein